MADFIFVMPGEELTQEMFPKHPSLPVKLGPGLRHIPPNSVVPTIPGQLCTDKKKNAIWVDSCAGRYQPAVGDLVIATIHHSSVDMYHASLTDHTPFAGLPQLSFEGATKKNRPQLFPGSLAYARVSLANKHMDPELECVSQATGKSEGLGPLTGGMLFDISLGMARRLMLARPGEQGKVVVLEEFGEGGVGFEAAIGRNGRLWLEAKNVKATLAIGRAVKETDEKNLTVEEQKKLVRKLIREL